MEQPEIQGFVIISLPPPDDPSKGKTITAFTMVSDPSHQNENQSQNQQTQQPQIASNSIAGSSRGRIGSIVVRVLAMLGAVVAVLFFWQWVSGFSEMDYETERSKNNPSFLYNLYPKWSEEAIEKDAALRLGTFVKRDEVRIGLRDVKTLEAISSINSSTIFPVKGNVYPDGLYYISILVGNPRRPYYLDMDTGSDLTWIQCNAPCTNCAKGPHPLYNPSKQNLVPSKDPFCLEVQVNDKGKFAGASHQCDYDIEYADQSSSMGVLVRDDLQLMITNGTVIKTGLVFGCAYDQRGKLGHSPAKTDGILGLSSAKVSLPSQLASRGLMKNVVGHCIRNDANGGGYMFLGDDFIPQWRMTWVPMLSSPSTNAYHAEVSKISLGSRPIDGGGLITKIGRVVFDSGSSYSYLTKQAYTSLIKSLKDVAEKGLVLDDSDKTLPVCWKAKSPLRSIKDVNQFFKPLVLNFGSRLLFGSKNFEIPPEGYLIISAKGNACLGILEGSHIHDGATNILGDISLRAKLVVYDNVKRRIGWVQSDCQPLKLKSFPFF
ncbi:hypothetical protein AMTRI_Chr04g250710 [Amborella trichopoda]|uniref:Peptidase A1 domain-containing protein n=1 Tax=Amborella trichopoda TaxID=13333 RepID=W1NFT3_AMBTC|nr:aspartyl protease APCB1 [Amborella trichopoda]ERM94054.1 hypothetical protein AMTR_s00010p00056950 [Amborella trichopoda]|eukprot:XP_006826817.1 aspartyl protease APCB1 [Amborella trichopoda]